MYTVYKLEKKQKVTQHKYLSPTSLPKFLSPLPGHLTEVISFPCVLTAGICAQRNTNVFFF